MTSLELSDDEKKEAARKRLQELCENPCSEDLIDVHVTEEDQEFIKNHRFPDGTKVREENNEQEEIPKDLTKSQFEKELIQKYHFKAMKDTKEIYSYDIKNGIYLNNADWLIEQECIKFNPDIKTTDVNDIKNHII